MNKNAKGFLWLAAVFANVAWTLWYLWLWAELSKDGDTNLSQIDPWFAMITFLLFGVPVLSVVALWTFRPRSESGQSN